MVSKVPSNSNNVWRWILRRGDLQRSMCLPDDPFLPKLFRTPATMLQAGSLPKTATTISPISRSSKMLPCAHPLHLRGCLYFPSPWIWVGLSLLWLIQCGRRDTMTIWGLGLNWPKSCHFLLVRVLSHHIKNPGNSFSVQLLCWTERPQGGATLRTMLDIRHWSCQGFRPQWSSDSNYMRNLNQEPPSWAQSSHWTSKDDTNCGSKPLYVFVYGKI